MNGILVEILQIVLLIGLASYDTAKPKPKKYEYDSHLDREL